MIDDTALELREVILRLATDADKVGLSHSDMASLIGIFEHHWPMNVRAQWSPGLTEGQETRLRHLAELCGLLDRTFGANAACWLRRDNGTPGLTPLTFLKSDGSALRALCDVLRAERDRTQ